MSRHPVSSTSRCSFLTLRPNFQRRGGSFNLPQEANRVPQHFSKSRTLVPKAVGEERSRDGEELAQPSEPNAGGETLATPTHLPDSHTENFVEHPATVRSASEIPFGIVSLLSGAGLLETAYLTWLKFNGETPVCFTGGGCGSVLESPYATVAGLPLPLYGMLTYGIVLGLAILGISGATSEDALAEKQLEDGLVAGASALISTSAVLVYVLAAKLGGEVCPWCIASAGLSTGIAYSVARGFDSEQLSRRVAPLASGVSASVLVGLGVAFSGISADAQGVLPVTLPYSEPSIATHSSEDAVSLARRLRDAGAKMYGAFWCGHCQAQKESFGQEAMQDFPYVECFPDGFRFGEDGGTTPVAKACSDVGIRGFPTWVINGQKYEGEQTFEQLQEELRQ
uniref:Vkor-domain-containing protein n=1 Tax=Tetraselmis sp. GSL018 TaxID=582737 RepID=A0A061R331_9CHLO|mmetsp:Transcript_11109/g.26359  ORF Transcript_11109/g.26359 Transcript_11109/m.26359 type:complete len:396 (-) Transcript_11109:203-1390(-)